MLVDELDLLDLTVKKFVRPRLKLNTTVLSQRWIDVETEKVHLLMEAGVTKDQVMSDAKFAAALRDVGVLEKDLPTKWSNPKKKDTYAFAKTDGGLFKLIDTHPQVAALVAARISSKSTQEMTRLQRMRDLGHVTGGWLNVPLLYYGAHTGRFSGLDFINLQNLGRGSVLREAIEAPKGCKLIAGDLSQIEARITAVLAKQWDLVAQFESGEDVYANFASEHYGYAVNKTDHPKERFVGKTGILSLGYQAGAQKFWATMNNVHNTEITIKEAEKIVGTYRTKYRKIYGLWYELEDYIRIMIRGIRTEFGPIEFQKNRVILPNGMPMPYRGLSGGTSNAKYITKNGTPTDLYGGKLLENIVQALARIVMTTAELRLAAHKLFAVLSVHDELVFCVKEEHADLIAAVVKDVMEQTVEWMPELPVKAEVAIGNNYKECK